MTVNSSIFHIQLGALLTVIATAILGSYSLISGWRQGVPRLFGIYSLFICGWCFCYFQMIVTDDNSKALFLGRFLHFFSSFIPATFLHFIQHITGTVNDRKQIWLRTSFYLSGIIFASIAFHPLFVTSVSPKMGFKHFVDWGPLYYFFYFAFHIYIVYAFYRLIRSYLVSSGQKKVQLSYTIVSYAIGYIGGCTVFFPHFNIPTPAPALYSIVFAHLILIYAIVQHRLLNLKLLIRRAGLLVLVYGLLITTAIPIFLFFQKQFMNISDLEFIMFSTGVIVISCVLSIGPFIYAYLVRRSTYFHEHAVAGLTHELKSPLAAIDNALQILNEMKHELPKGGRQAEYLEMIDRNSSRLRQYVNDLLQVVKTQNQEIPLNLEEFELGTLCRDIAGYLSSLAKDKSIQINLTTVPDKINLEGDKTKIEQAVSNVLSNAIKFTREGTINVSIVRDETQIVIQVKDSGLGIESVDLPHVFERFYQGKNGRGKGSGIGLTIAKAWVEAHGGKIWAESEGEGKGTTVKFTLPI